MKKIVAILLGTLTISHALACTAINVEAKDGSVVAGRTMEWALDMEWQMVYLPKGSEYNLTAPLASGLKPLAVRNKYAVFGVGTALEDNALLEGQNSAGLGLSGNFLPGFTHYQTVSKQDTHYLSVISLAKLILGNYASVAEVKANLPKYKVWSTALKNLPIEPSIHFMLSDKKGNATIIEFINGEMKFFDKTPQIMTNSPNYDWHLLNLRNYLNLSNTGVAERNASSLGNVTQLGQGGGSIGLPGDYTPPSRFVKTSFLKYYSTQAQNADGAVELVGHILNNVDIPIGVLVATENGKTISDYTQWLAIKDISHNQFYFADYAHRLNLVKINLTKVFILQEPFTLPIAKLHYPENDITSTLLNH